MRRSTRGRSSGRHHEPKFKGSSQWLSTQLTPTIGGSWGLNSNCIPQWAVPTVNQTTNTTMFETTSQSSAQDAVGIFVYGDRAPVPMSDYLIREVRGEILLQLEASATFAINDAVVCRLGILVRDEEYSTGTSSLANPAHIASMRLHWLWTHTTLWTFAGFLTGSILNYQSLQKVIPVRIKRNIVMKPGCWLDLVVIWGTDSALPAAYQIRYIPLLRALCRTRD